MSKTDWDNWRNCEIKRQILESENENLKQKVTKLESDLYKLRLKAQTGSRGVDVIVDAIAEEADKERQHAEELSNEVTQLEEKNSKMRQAILDVFNLVRDEVNRNIERMGDNYKALEPVKKAGQLSDLSQAILDYTAGPPNREIEIVRQMRQERREARSNRAEPADMYVQVRETLEIIVNDVRTSNATYLLSLMAGTANEVNKIPGYIAGEIIRQCKSKGGPDIELVQLFPLEMLHTDNPKEAPKKHVVLKTGLEWAQKFIKSGVTSMGTFLV